MIGTCTVVLHGHQGVVTHADPHIHVTPQLLGGAEPTDPDGAPALLLLGTDHLGLGTVAYVIGGWDDDAGAWHATRLDQP